MNYFLKTNPIEMNYITEASVGLMIIIIWFIQSMDYHTILPRRAMIDIEIFCSVLFKNAGI